LCCANRSRFNVEAFNFCSAAGANVLKDSSVAKEPRAFIFEKALVNNLMIFNFEFGDCDIQHFWFPNARFRVAGNLPAKNHRPSTEISLLGCGVAQLRIRFAGRSGP
jgi:hypothetical protein